MITIHILVPLMALVLLMVYIYAYIMHNIFILTIYSCQLIRNKPRSIVITQFGK
jgi:hypothetical protein